MQFTGKFENAQNDYLNFLEKGYPSNAVHKLVCDRYLLSGIERSMLFRGVFKRIESLDRKKKQVQADVVKGKILIIDCLNQVLTVAGYLEGKTVYKSTDGFVRDAAEYHGNLPPNIHLERAIEKIVISLLKLNPLHTDFIIDQQVMEHKAIAAMIRFDAFEERFPFQVIITDKTDQRLKKVTKGIIATSDSQIIDHTKLSVFDLAHYVLTDQFQPNLPDLSALL